MTSIITLVDLTDPQYNCSVLVIRNYSEELRNMAHTISIIEGGLVFIFSGIVTETEIKIANSDAYNHPDFDRMRFFIWDMNAVEEIRRDRHDPAMSAATDLGASRSSKSLKGAFVVNNHQVAKYIAEYMSYAKSLSIPWEYRIFSTINDAKQWVLAPGRPV